MYQTQKLILGGPVLYLHVYDTRPPIYFTSHFKFLISVYRSHVSVLLAFRLNSTVNHFSLLQDRPHFLDAWWVQKRCSTTHPSTYVLEAGFELQPFYRATCTCCQYNGNDFGLNIMHRATCTNCI